MEAFNFDDFENVFLDCLRENSEFFEECAKELRERAVKLEISVEKCESLTEIIVRQGDYREFEVSEMNELVISGKSNAGFRVFSDIIENELVIDLRRTPSIYEKKCSVPLSFIKIDSEIITHRSIYKIGSHYIIPYIEPNGVLKLEIGKSFNLPEVSYSLNSISDNQISFKNANFNSIILGRKMSGNSIYLSEQSISREHAEIHFNSSNWEIKDKSRYGTWKALHTFKSMELGLESKKHFLTSNLRVKFNGIDFKISPVFSNY